MLAVDDSHATGVLGETGGGRRGTYGLLGEVDIITSTLGKALGGAAGGFVAGSTGVCDMLTQRSRPQAVLERASADRRVQRACRDRVRREASGPRGNSPREHAVLSGRDHGGGSTRLQGDTPIVPIIVGETALAIRMSNMLLDEHVFVTGFGYPVVPQGQARVRCQLSAAHTKADLQ